MSLQRVYHIELDEVHLDLIIEILDMTIEENKKDMDFNDFEWIDNIADLEDAKTGLIGGIRNVLIKDVVDLAEVYEDED